jgi:hypothetical protein
MLPKIDNSFRVRPIIKIVSFCVLDLLHTQKPKIPKEFGFKKVLVTDHIQVGFFNQKVMACYKTKSLFSPAVASDSDALQIVGTNREPISLKKKIVKGNFPLRKDRYQCQKAAFPSR